MKKFKILAFMFVIMLSFSIIPMENVNASTASNEIVVFVGDTWSLGIKANSYLCTKNGNSLSSKDTREHATASISGSTVTIKGTSSGTNWFYLCKKDKKIYRSIHITVKVAPSINSITNSNESKGKSKSSNVYLYEGQSANVDASVSGSRDSFNWSVSGGATINSPSSTGTSIKANNRGTYTLTAKAITKSNGKRGTVTVTKSITVYVSGQIPSIDIMANGTSITSFSMKQDETVALSYRLNNTTSDMKCSVSAAVASNSTNCISLQKASDGTYKLTAKNGFSAGTNATIIYTLKVSGDSVSNNNGDSSGTITYTRNVTVTLGTGNVSSYINIMNSAGKVMDENIYVANYANFYVQDSSGFNDISFIVEDSNVVKVTSAVGVVPGIKSNRAFMCQNKTGKTKVTVVAKNSSGLSHTRIYYVHNIDVVSSIKVNTARICLNEKEKPYVQGVTISNYYNNIYSDVYINESALSYTVENPNIASVNDNGEIVAKKIGTTKVKVVYKFSYDRMVKNPNTNELERYSVQDPSTTFDVYVFDKIKNIKFKDGKVYVTQGNSYKQQPVNYPLNAFTNDKYTWTSSDKDVATVDNEGNVSAKSIGSTVITAMATDGSKKEDSYTLYVKSKAPSKVKAKSKGKYISISWNKTEQAENYEIYRKTKGSYKRIGVSGSSSYKDANAKYGAKYVYKIVAVPNSGPTFASDLSSASKKVKFIPPTPKIKKIKKSGGGYRVTIKGTGYDGVVIYAGKKKKTKTIVANITGKSATVFLGKKKKYYIRCRAYNKSGSIRIYSKYSKAKKYKTK